MSSLVHLDNNNKKGIFSLGKGPADLLEDPTLIAEKEYFINFTEQQKNFGVTLHYYGLNRYVCTRC